MVNIARKDWSRDKYSTRQSWVLYFVSRPMFECYICHIAGAKGSALSGIENVRLEAIHRNETIRNSPNSLEKQRSHSYWHCFCAGQYIPSLLGLISWVYRITCQYRTLGCRVGQYFNITAWTQYYGVQYWVSQLFWQYRNIVCAILLHFLEKNWIISAFKISYKGGLRNSKSKMCSKYTSLS